MTYQVWVESRADRGYRAATLGWLRCEAEGDTREEALRNIEAAVESVLTTGEIVTLEAHEHPDAPDPWLEQAGIFRDDPHWDEFQAAITEYRRAADARERADGGQPLRATRPLRQT